MKKIKLIYGILITLIILTSCSNNDDGNSNNNSNIEFNPPAWIQGVWFNQNSTSGYKFTSNDIIRLNLDENNNIIGEDSRKEYWSLFDDAYLLESSSENLYKAVIEMDGNEYEYNEFNKISEDTMILGTSLTWIKQ
tara:strand:+ start:704 stop:1111 length:408 start_codon:yes stop_codon:yes gene_type:complete